MKKILLYTLVFFSIYSLGVSKTLQASDLNASPEAYIGKDITFEGLMTGVCHHGGKKAFFKDLSPEDSPTIRVECVKGQSFDRAHIGDDILIQGVVRELRIDEAYLSKWEATVAASIEEEEEEEEGCGQCGGGCNDKEEESPVLQKIAKMREQLAESDKGYLSAIWIDGTSWEVIEQE